MTYNGWVSLDYKHLFGESPSVTFRRTEAQLPRSERRHQPGLGAGAGALRTASNR